jgi:hypothetical protein
LCPKITGDLIIYFTRNEKKTKTDQRLGWHVFNEEIGGELSLSNYEFSESCLFLRVSIEIQNLPKCSKIDYCALCRAI